MRSLYFVILPKHIFQSFVHCSTAYVNVDKQGDIEEKQYKVVCDPYKLMDVSSMLNSSVECKTKEKHPHNCRFKRQIFAQPITIRFLTADCLDSSIKLKGQSWMTDEMLDGITDAMCKQYFNTYCFTKHVAEVSVHCMIEITVRYKTRRLSWKT